MNDDELLARLKSADPALTGSAPPPDVNRLVEDTLNTDTALRSATAAAGITAAGRGRRHVFGLAAAAAVLVLGGGIAGGIMAHDGNNGSSAKGPSTPAGALRLTAQGGSGKCAVPGLNTLSKYPVLFEGTVTSADGSTTTFRVDRWFKGGDAKTVVVESDTEIPETLTFAEGQHYIVGAENGFVPPCAAIDASPDTISEFRQAFGK
ncbi:hypothetical protein JHN63_04180 [Streptomyces sp. MBT65]|uniref:hypothetical protein n=1 Tax=Streptomyces sp. MBT65 TaxID=1488395 RepID=UPI00190CBF7A|nr:hypothetical protein [Streptomyces sp. MBT65]MBK3573034.1 hypothetical protein [Streptomyces sp. MBT65]